LPRGLTKSIFLNSVRGGKGLMPPFGEALTSAEAELLWSYVNAQISDSNQQN
jgi:mono/diheme cytochrome c family protein